jgi:hypothetical protein
MITPPSPLSRESIEKRRSPRDLLVFIESVREQARNDSELRTAGHLRSGYAKEFFDEIVPLGTYAAKVYPESYTILPILGNQGYDAEVFGPDGVLVERVEMANPIDGQAVSEAGRQLAESGISNFRVDDPGDDLERVTPILERTAARKATKDYSDSVVVFNVSACPAFRGFEARHKQQLERVRSALSRASFNAKRVYVLLPSGQVEQIDA